MKSAQEVFLVVRIAAFAALAVFGLQVFDRSLGNHGDLSLPWLAADVATHVVGLFVTQSSYRSLRAEVIANP